MKFEVVGLWSGVGTTSRGTVYFTVVLEGGRTVRFWMPDGQGIESAPNFGEKVKVEGVGYPAGKGAFQLVKATIAKV